jgi:hypothetical protein
MEYYVVCSLIAQGHHRVHAHGAPGGNETSRERNDREQPSDGNISHWILGTDRQKTPDYTAHPKRTSNAHDQPYCDD